MKTQQLDVKIRSNTLTLSINSLTTSTDKFLKFDIMLFLGSGRLTLNKILKILESLLYLKKSSTVDTPSVIAVTLCEAIHSHYIYNTVCSYVLQHSIITI